MGAASGHLWRLIQSLPSPLAAFGGGGTVGSGLLGSFGRAVPEAADPGLRSPERLGVLPHLGFLKACVDNYAPETFCLRRMGSASGTS